MEKTYEFTEEELLIKCRTAFMMSTLQIIIMQDIEKDKQESALDNAVKTILNIFIT